MNDYSSLLGSAAYNYSYLILLLPGIVLGLIAQLLVKTRFASYDKVKSKKNITGAQAAQFLLQKSGINDVRVVHISGNLTDNYNPTNKVLSLSDATFSSTSIAAIGVAAHETGHAIQHHVNYQPLNTRSRIVPAANFGSRFGPILVMLGILAGSASTASSQFAQFAGLSNIITMVGIALFSLAVLFSLVTLPVEFNASNRALKILKEYDVFDSDELNGTRKVLGAAAMTYVASALSAIGSLLRLMLIAKSNKRR